jgi:hypothetical protein
MSFPKKGKSFPKKGKSFPKRGGDGSSEFSLDDHAFAMNAILLMADRQDRLLGEKVEDLRRKVLELAAIIGEPMPSPEPIPSIRGLATTWLSNRVRQAAIGL